jgi:hypothetical protein
MAALVFWCPESGVEKCGWGINSGRGINIEERFRAVVADPFRSFSVNAPALRLMDRLEK